MRLPDLLHRSPPTLVVSEVYTVDDAFGWAADGLKRSLQRDATGQSLFNSSELRHLLTDRHLTTSSAFSGIEAPSVADDAVSAAAHDWLQDNFDDNAGDFV